MHLVPMPTGCLQPRRGSGIERAPWRLLSTRPVAEFLLTVKSGFYQLSTILIFQRSDDRRIALLLGGIVLKRAALIGGQFH
jgi:hypothetical protein